GDLFWVACGSQLYLFSGHSTTGMLLPSPLSNIVALEAVKNGVIAGGDNNQIYGIDHSGSTSLPTAVSGTLRGFAVNYVSTSTGIYNLNDSVALVVAGNDSA